MGYFQVRYDSRVVIYDRKGFIRLALVTLNEEWDKAIDRSTIFLL